MTAIFPILPGLGYDVVRTPMWSTNIQTAVSGKETGVGSQSYPRWQWSLTYNFLRSDSTAEFQTLVAFFNSQQGMLSPFLYQDAEDNAVTGQLIGTGDGATTAFQLARRFGSTAIGFIEPMFAPNIVSHVYINGVAASGWTASPYDSATPGVITFASAPAAGAAITVDFSFYFPCRFLADTQDFSLFMSRLWKTDSLKFISLK